MRRKHCEITDAAEIDRILRTARIGRMATMGSDGYPYITPVNYVWYMGKIYFHCARSGEKMDNLARDPKVCFQVDIPLAYLDTGFDPEKLACKAHQFYHCVIVRGEARVVPEGPLKLAALNALVASHEPDAEFTPVTEDMHPYKICHVVEITPSSISCKADLWQNKSPEERRGLGRYLKKRNLPSDQAAIRALGFDPAEL
jgi:uncharacterized protein